MSGRAAGAEHLATALRAGVGSFVTVRGPMGSGKSELLRGVAAQAGGVVVLRASGDPAERGWDYGVVEQLRPVPDGFVVVLVDDLQWADPSSVRWLIGLASRALVVAALREGEPGAGALPGSVVRLPALPSVVWSARRVAECMRRQPESVRDVARAVAVLGRHAEVELVSALTGLDEGVCGSAVRTLRALGFVTAQGRPQFVAQAVADAVVLESADDCHRAAAVLLHERGRPVAHVADHLVASGAPLDEWAVEVLREAARTGPNAVTYLRRAVVGPGRAATLVDLAVAECGTNTLLALQHLCYAVELLPAGRARAEAVLKIPVTALGTALPLVRDVLDDVGRDVREPDLVVRLEARARYAGHTDPSELVDATARLKAVGPDSDAERELLAVLAHSATLQARTPAHEIAALAEHLLARSPTAEMTRLLVKVLCAADSPPAAVTDGLVAAHVGDLAEARRLTARALDGPVGQDALLDLAAVALKLQDEQLCARLLAAVPSEVDNPGTAAALDLVRGADAAARGDSPGGLRLLLDAGARLDRLGWRNVVLFPWRTAAARLHQQLGNVDAARILAEENLERALEWGAPAGIGRARRVLGGLTDGAESLDLLQSAMDALSQSANRVELARTHLTLGLRLRERSGPAAAAHLQACHDIALTCGDHRLARQAATHLRGDVRRADLTRTERKVVALAAQGRSNQEIAEALSVGTRTVEKHLTNSYRKLGVVSRADLASAFNHPF
ncbi:LuxR C-terminal-related transcriptional regulator [Lentzea sp. JNUCC 0626]|uniref:helix-turn-helix transcriptional regulator n=1 Tax=Lentzea sp. JNUCC 0626 TaxID=3367513 RepID=UPI003748AFB7